MRRVVATEYVTLDGVMEDPGGVGIFSQGGWHVPFWNDETMQFKHNELFTTDALLLGRVTYQEFAAAWPSVTDETGFADRMNSLPKYVVSTTLERATWNNSTLIKSDVVTAVATLKQQPGQDVVLHGSADLLHFLMQHDLVDEYRLLVHPVVAGRGKRLFRGGAAGSVPKMLRLVAAQSFSSGVVVLSYQPEPTA